MSEARRTRQTEVARTSEIDDDSPSPSHSPHLATTVDDPLNQHGSGGDAKSLREVLVGMIEENSRYLGHVDLLRERIDERVGQ